MSRWIMLLAGLGLASLLGGCSYFSGPNVIHVGSGLQSEAYPLGLPGAIGQTNLAAGDQGQGG